MTTWGGRHVDGPDVAEPGVLQQLDEPARGQQLAADVRLERLDAAHQPAGDGPGVLLPLGEGELRHEERAPVVQGAVHALDDPPDVTGLVQADVDDRQVVAAIDVEVLEEALDEPEPVADPSRSGAACSARIITFWTP
jgi:hypothetical protein